MLTILKKLVLIKVNLQNQGTGNCDHLLRPNSVSNSIKVYVMINYSPTD